jgi:hypothetical protein
MVAVSSSSSANLREIAVPRQRVSVSVAAGTDVGGLRRDRTAAGPDPVRSTSRRSRRTSTGAVTKRLKAAPSPAESNSRRVGAPMQRQDRTPRATGTSATPDPGDEAELRTPDGSDAVAPVGHTVRLWALETLVAAYGGNTHRLLTDLADLLEASVAYVDRPTVEAHLERPLSDGEWSAVAAQFTAMAFDEHVGNAGTLRTDWIEDRLSRAGLPGRTPPAPPKPGPPRQPVRR